MTAQIPLHLYSADLSQLVHYCVREGIGKLGEGAWRPNELSDMGLPMQTWKDIVNYVPFSPTSFDKIVHVFGENFSEREEWKRVCLSALSAYQKKHKTVNDKNASVEVIEKLKNARCFFDPEGIWLYALVKRSPDAKDKSPLLIVGTFAIEQFRVNQGIAFEVINDGESNKLDLRSESSWISEEVAVGYDCIYVKYHATRYPSQLGQSSQVFGFVTGKLTPEPTTVGAVAMRGWAYDEVETNTLMRSEFYAERCPPNYVLEKSRLDDVEDIIKKMHTI